MRLDFFWDLWERSKTGEEITEKEFDMKLFKKTMELKKDFGINFNLNSPVLTDRTMAKDLYQAGLTLFLELGTYCRDTGRILKITEEELKECLKRVPYKIELGDGNERITVGGNPLEGKKHVVIAGGPCACPVSEDLFVEIMYSYAKEDGVKAIYPGLLTTFKGKNIQTRTLLEIAAAREEASLTRKALIKAGRPGMPIIGIVHPSAEASNFADGKDGLRPTDLHEIDPLNELKVDVETFKRIYYCIRNDYFITSMVCPILGGFAGGPEGTAMVAVAEALQGFTLINAHVFSFGITHINTRSGTDRASLWASGAALLALKNVLPAPVGSLIWAAAGPCTDIICYEIMAKTIVDTVCGADLIMSAGSTGGKLTNHYTGMEARMAYLTSKASVGMTLEYANDVIKELLKLYEEKLLRGNLPRSKSFNECYTSDGFPSREYVEIWDECKKILVKFGIENIS